MPTYVARIAQDGKILLERAEVTVEQLDPERWRGRFFVPAGMRLLRGLPVELAFADGRHGRARVDHVHPALSRRGPRLAEITGTAPIS
ncbi:MAG: hypothetical protein ACM3NS_08010 [Deltaproteobacteria bacterium]